MAKKVVLFFFIILFFYFTSIRAVAQNIPENSFNEIKKAANNLKNVEKLPSAENIGLIASTIKNTTEAY